jgi:hypothetical protein
VAELAVVRDRLTDGSKGSAFVWYATRAAGEQAILQFNMRHMLPDPTGEQDRPLVVSAPHPAAAPALLGLGQDAWPPQAGRAGRPRSPSSAAEAELLYPTPTPQK